MSECQCLEACPFFNDEMSGMPQATEMYKEEYCKGDNSNCARFLVFQALGKPMVPSDLYPFQVSRAKNLIAENQ